MISFILIICLFIILIGYYVDQTKIINEIDLEDFTYNLENDGLELLRKLLKEGRIEDETQD